MTPAHSSSSGSRQVQRLQTELDQYTDLTEEQRQEIRAGPSPKTTFARSAVPTSKPRSA